MFTKRDKGVSCFCRFQSSRLSLLSCQMWATREELRTTWALKFFLLCFCLHSQQKACNKFSRLVKTRPVDFWSQVFGHSPSTLSYASSKTQAAQPRHFITQPKSLPVMQYRKGIKKCFCKKSQQHNLTRTMLTWRVLKTGILQVFWDSWIPQLVGLEGSGTLSEQVEK